MVRGAQLQSFTPEISVPAMPVANHERGKTVEEHRACVTAVLEERIKANREDLVSALLMTAAVARLIPRSETPQAKKALEMLNGKLRSKGTWGESRVKECKTVIAKPRQKGLILQVSLRRAISRAASLLWATLAESAPFSKETLRLMRTMSKFWTSMDLNLGLVSSKGMQSKHTRRRCSKALD